MILILHISVLCLLHYYNDLTFCVAIPLQLEGQVTGACDATKNHADSSTRNHNSFTAVQPTAPAKATPPGAYQAPLDVPVFSRRREVLVGRVAMAGFYASCMWEVRSNLVAVSPRRCMLV